MRTRNRFLVTVLTVLGLTVSTALIPTPAAAASPSFVETFDTPAPFGQVDSTYPNSWQPYPNGMSGKYYSDEIAQVTKDGYLDFVLDGKRGAAGTFGTAEGAWGHVGGTFTIRARATGANGNGVAVMLWPTSDKWSDGEIDFPEGGIGGGTAHPQVFHHSTVPGHEGDQVQFDSGVTWNTWHDYTIIWVPGKSVTYQVDGKTIGVVTKWVPTTPHRFMIQMGNTGKPGHVLVSKVTTTE